MGDSDEWIRNSRWDEQEQKLFFEKLGRARFQKPYYIRQKANALAASATPEKIDAAIELLERAIREYPESYEKINDQRNLADWHARRNRLDRAADHYRRAMDPQKPASVAVEFLLLILRRLPELKPEARRILEDLKDQFMHGFIRERFVLHAVRAVLRHEDGDFARARVDAEAALRLSERTQSGLADYPTLGLVEGMGDLIDAVREIVQDPAGAGPRPEPEDETERLALKLRAQLSEVMNPPDLDELVHHWKYPPAAHPVLLRFLTEIPGNVPFRYAIITSLRDPAVKRVPEAARILIDEFRKTPPQQRWTVAMALHPCLKKADLPFLQDAVADRGNGPARGPLISALARLLRERAVPLLLQVLAEPPLPRQDYGTQLCPGDPILALGNVGDLSCIEVITPYLKHLRPQDGEPCEVTRRAAERAIAKLKKRFGQ